MIGTAYPQQEVPRKIDPHHRDLQAPRQLQGDQAQGQGLSASALQHLVQQGGGGAQGGEVILGEPQVIHYPQQRLAQLIGRQQRHAEADLLLQHREVSQDRLRVHGRVVLGSDP